MGTFPLCIFQETLDSNLIVKILEGHLLQQARIFHQDQWFLVEDNDPKHTSKVTKAWMSEYIPGKSLDWPSQSPDINLIENLFAWVKQELIKRRPNTIPDLIRELLSIWENIDTYLEPYWSSMAKRCQMLLDSEGYKIKY